MFETLLIANRGEIACRVIRTARKMGIRTIAVYSEADAGALHTLEADEAIAIGPAPARESYLRGEKIIAAALETGADAIHPGYGFLSENAEFAEACERAGITFVGPSAEAIRAMGNKDEAKRRMESAEVPIVPGEHGEAQDYPTWAQAAERIGYPVLVKAVAGGGGKGMRRVDRPDALEAALEAAAREAESSFGDRRLLIEKWLEPSRHVEVQIFADGHGNAIHLFERDCSIQRGHQKVLEEAPAPGLSESTRLRMGETAVRVARAIDYQGAGTVEFIVDAGSESEDPPFYFMEMNTRLQVEHPVTEAITGTDLVEWQLRVAAGEPLPRSQEDIQPCGHAIEVRVYAEDPARRYLPQTGTLVHHRPSPESAHTRVDNGVAEGSAITFHYDPMISKLIVQAPDRTRAIRRLQEATRQYEVAGLKTNLGLLNAIAMHPAFAAGRVTTSFLQDHEIALISGLGEPPEHFVALACAALLEQRRHGSYPQKGEDPYSPWATTDSFRLNEDGLDSMDLIVEKRTLHILVHPTAAAITLEWDGHAIVLRDIAAGEARISAMLDGQPREASVLIEGSIVHVMADARTASFEIAPEKVSSEDSGTVEGIVRSPMPGKITAVLVQEGESVEVGQRLVQLEAMKMEHTLVAPTAGKVVNLRAKLYLQVDEGQELLAVH